MLLERIDVETVIAMLAPSLLVAFKQVPDPRKTRGTRHSLPSVLTLATCAMFFNCRTLRAIAHWGREHQEFAQLLGFSRTQTPSLATLHIIFGRLDCEAFETALGRWILSFLSGRPEPKAIYGEGAQDGLKVPGLHLVSSYTQSAGIEMALREGRKQLAVGLK